MKKRQFEDYTVKDLEVVEEIETSQSSVSTVKFTDYTESYLEEVRLTLEDVFDLIAGKHWQVLARTKNAITISRVFDSEISDLSETEVLSIKSEFFFEVLDRQSRFTASSMQKKVAKVRNSQNYYWLAEEVEINELDLKGDK